jgi:predicted ester cyclase
MRREGAGLDGPDRVGGPAGSALRYISVRTIERLSAGEGHAPLASPPVEHKDVVRRFVDEAVNGGRMEVVDELVLPELADRVRGWFGAFRASFPDMRMRLVELVADGDTVVGRFACSATHAGEWRGHAPTGRRFEDVDEVYFFSFVGDRIGGVWGLEDTLDRFQQLGLDPKGPPAAT